MEWLSENLGKMLPLILAALYFWLNARKRRPDEDEAESPDGPDEMERARGIQEEIRRRILERQRGGSPGPHVAPPVLVETSLHQEQEWQVRPADGAVRDVVVESPEVDHPEPVDRSVLERQARLEKQFERARLQMETRKRNAGPAPRPAESGPDRGWVSKKGGPRSALRSSLLRDLKSPTGLKRAILLREVLGEPVGLRRGPLPQK